MRWPRRVGDFWIPARAERLTPALVLLSAFVALLLALALLDAPESLFLLTISMGPASAAVAATTLFWKASAHCAVAGHAAVAGLVGVDPLGTIFLLALPLVVWSRITMGLHTSSPALARAGIGAAFALLFLT